MATRNVAAHAADFELLREKAARLRIDSVESTTQAGSGHPTSCASAADIVATLFFSVMRFDPHSPGAEDNDVFILSKGHAAPLLYAAWAEAGAFPRARLLTLRKSDSDLEGHPVPSLPFVPVATGSLGQGLSVGAGIAFHARHSGHKIQRVYVLMGDGESAEGSVWEAAQWAAGERLSNLCATIDINRLGQSGPTMLQYDTEAYRNRWEAFGWQALVVDGHDLPQLLAAYERAQQTTDRPTVVLARTIKGKGLPGIEGEDHWHGKPLDAEAATRVIGELKKQLGTTTEEWEPKRPLDRQSPAQPEREWAPGKAVATPYKVGGRQVSTRKGFGDGLAALARNPRVFALDGDVRNSTYTEEFQAAAPDRFLESYIAEQNMIGLALGLAARTAIPFAATFASFLTRAYDFIRMGAISRLNIKVVGTHVGVSIGEDGPSQMGLEDLAMMCAQPNFTVLYPSDATSAWRAAWLAAEHAGPCYLRIGRPDAPVLYNSDEPFAIGKCKTLRRGTGDRALVVAAGVTVAEALTAYDQLLKDDIPVRIIDLFSIQPLDREELLRAAAECNGTVITVEDHYAHGGLGDAVCAALPPGQTRCYKLAVREIAHSGKPTELLHRFGISARHIVEKVKEAVSAAHSRS